MPVVTVGSVGQRRRLVQGHLIVLFKAFINAVLFQFTSVVLGIGTCFSIQVPTLSAELATPFFVSLLLFIVPLELGNSVFLNWLHQYWLVSVHLSARIAEEVVELRVIVVVVVTSIIRFSAVTADLTSFSHL